MADIKDWSSLSKHDPEWEQYVKDNMGGNPPDLGMFPDIASMRKWLVDAKAAMGAQLGPNIPGVKEQDHQVQMRDGEKIACRVYQPETPPSGGSPLAVIFHGGGWCIGGIESEEMLCRLLTSKLGVTCVNVDYRLAPEHKFPTAVHDAYDALKWAATSASSLGADPSKGFIVGGTSAGGNLTSVVSHIYRDEGLKPTITGCHLMIPMLCDHAYVPEKYRSQYKSWDQNANAAILSRKACDLFIDNYIPDKGERNNPMFSPWLFPSGQKNLPPSYFQICGLDPLRDEALIFEKILREEEGIKTKVDVYPGQPHGFWSIAPTMKKSQNFVDDSLKGFQWLLAQKA